MVSLLHRATINNDRESIGYYFSIMDDRRPRSEYGKVTAAASAWQLAGQINNLIVLLHFVHLYKVKHFPNLLK